MQSKVIRFHETGDPSVLQSEMLDVGEPGEGEILVRIEAIGLNRAEAAFRAGHYIEPPKLPARIGYEAAGVIEALGEGVNDFNVDDSVCVIPAFSMNQYGVYAERAIVPAYSVVKRPPGLNTEEAASIWMQYLTAFGALIDVAGIGQGDHVIITAASSSVGLAATQICNSVGAVPIAVTRTEDKKEKLIKLGAAHVVVMDQQEMVDEVMQITNGQGARLAFDPIAGPITGQLAAALGKQGMLILYGNLSGKAMETVIPFGPTVGKGLSIRGYLVFEIIQDAQRMGSACKFIEEGLEKGTLKPVIDKVFTLDEIVDAHRYLEASQQIGKIIVTVG